MALRRDSNGVIRFTNDKTDPKEIKITQINKACEANITNGFYSSALGSEHLYRFNKEEDQLNFNQQVSLLLLDSTIEEIDWKTEDAGVLPHSRQQFLQVVNDASSHKKACISQYWQIKMAILSSSNIDEIEGFSWNYIR